VPALRAYPDESLYAAWLRRSRRGLRQLAVAERGPGAHLASINGMDAVTRALRLPIRRDLAPSPAPNQAAHGVHPAEVETSRAPDSLTFEA
jgi:hypothetical protein